MKSIITKIKLMLIIISLFALIMKLQAQETTVTRSHFDVRTKSIVTTTSTEVVVNNSVIKGLTQKVQPITNYRSFELKRPTLSKGIKLRDTTCPGLQGTVYVGTGVGTPAYSTFNGKLGLFADINNRALSGNLTVIVQQRNITEPDTATLLNAIYYCAGGPFTVTIQPAQDSLYTISGTTVYPTLIGFNGAANIIIDGQYNGDGNKWLKFLNITPGTNDVVLFQNNSNHITIKNCYIEGATGGLAANVFFGTCATTGTGNSFITIDHNHIGSLSYAAAVIASVNFSTTTNHDNNITNNDIFDFTGTFDATNNNNYSAGLYIYGSGNGSNWNISNNSIYNTSTIGSGGQIAIYFLAGSGSNNNIISGNYIGGSAAKRSGTWTTAASGYEDYGISINAGTVTLDRDTIENIFMNDHVLSAFICMDIYGATQPTITHCSFNNVTIYGGGQLSCFFFICNPVGAPGYIYGVRSVTSSIITFSNNNLKYLDALGGGDDRYYGGYVRSFSHTGSGAFVFTNNLMSGPQGACTNTSSYGIYISNTSLSGEVTGCNISNNTIDGPWLLANANKIGTSLHLESVFIEGNWTGVMSKNRIMNNFNEAHDAPSICLHFVNNSVGTWTISNNEIISVNNSWTPTRSASRYGFMDETTLSCTLNVYYNSMYIGGTDGGGYGSYAFYRDPGVTGSVFGSVMHLYDNIIMNNRTGSGGSHVAIANNGSSNYGAGFTSDYNFIVANNISAVGSWGGAPIGFANWKASSGGDNNSTNAYITAGNSDATHVNPTELFINPSSDLHIQLTPPYPPYPYSFIAGMGKPVSILDDFDGNIRSTKMPPAGSTMGIQEITACKPFAFSSQLANPPEQCGHATINLTTSATGDGTLSYQWQVNNGSWTNITDGGTNPKYTGSGTSSLNVDSATTTLMFRCIGSNCAGKGGDTTNIVTLTIVKPIQFISISSNKIKCSGDTAIFKVLATGDSIHYQWTKNGANIFGATKSALNFNPVSVSDSALYTCNLSNTCNNFNPSAHLTVNYKATFIDTISNQSKCQGDSLTLTVDANGPSLSYQWTKGGNNINGATSSVYKTGKLTAKDFDIYSCNVTNMCGISSLPNFIIDVKSPPSVSNVYVTQVKNQGDNLLYSVSPSGTGPFSYQWYQSDSLLTGETNSSFSISSITCLDSGIYKVKISNECGNMLSKIARLYVTQCQRIWHSISGYVKYDNKDSTAMSSKTPGTLTHVYLKNSLNVTIDSTLTDDTGGYAFIYLVNDTYTVYCTTNKPAGGINPVDALMANRYYLGLFKITDPMKKLAADCNGDTKINPTDALMINRRYIGILHSFKAGDWIFQSQTILINGQDITKTILAICRGDVNGSYVPPPRIIYTPVNNEGIINIAKQKVINIPVYLKENTDLGAIGIKLKIKNEKLKINNVISDLPGLIYYLSEEGVNIAWTADNSGYKITPDKPILMLNVIYTGADDSQENQLSSYAELSSESVIADFDGNYIITDKISMPLLTSGNKEAAINLTCYPNPFNSITNINYTLAEDANVKVAVYNVLGEEIATLINKLQKAGSYNISFNGSNLKQGVYYCKIETSNADSSNSRTNIMVITR